MLLAVLLLIAGAVVLIAGAESAIRGTSRLAISRGIPAFVLGALLFGIDLEGLSAVLAEGRGVRRRAAELEHEAEEIAGSGRRAALIAVLGLGAVYGGAWLLVDGGIRVVARTSLSAGFVGAAIVGTLAGLDEVFLE